MNAFLIILKEIKHNLRDYKANMMMILFPIVLIIILGAAFSNVFDNSIEFGEIKVLYTFDNKDSAPAFMNAFKSFSEQMSSEMDMHFEETEHFESAMTNIENNTYSAYLHIDGEKLSIDMYKNETRGITASIVENAMEGFIDTYVTVRIIAANNPAALAVQQDTGGVDHVRIKSIDGKKQPGSTDYYAITMLTMILMYASQTGFWSIRSEIEAKTAARTLCAPVHKYELLVGKVIGCIFITIIQAFAVILFSGLVLKADWGGDLLAVVLLVIPYSIMTVSLGVALAYLIKSGEAANGVLNTIIPIVVFLGGGYVPLSQMGSIVSEIGDISPVKWINSALLNLIYNGNYSRIPGSIAIDLGLAVLFITIAVLFSRRRDRAYA